MFFLDSLEVVGLRPIVPSRHKPCLVSSLILSASKSGIKCPSETIYGAWDSYSVWILYSRRKYGYFINVLHRLYLRNKANCGSTSRPISFSILDCREIRPNTNHAPTSKDASCICASSETGGNYWVIPFLLGLFFSSIEHCPREISFIKDVV